MLIDDALIRTLLQIVGPIHVRLLLVLAPLLERLCSTMEMCINYAQYALPSSSSCLYFVHQLIYIFFRLDLFSVVCCVSDWMRTSEPHPSVYGIINWCQAYHSKCTCSSTATIARTHTHTREHTNTRCVYDSRAKPLTSVELVVVLPSSQQQHTLPNSQSIKNKHDGVSGCV